MVEPDDQFAHKANLSPIEKHFLLYFLVYRYIFVLKKKWYHTGFVNLGHTSSNAYQP
jgi:hypothetical protein